MVDLRRDGFRPQGSRLRPGHRQSVWTYNLPTGSDGVPAVYEVGGREYIAFCVAGGDGYQAPREPAGAAQPMNSYMVFALPRK